MVEKTRTLKVEILSDLEIQMVRLFEARRDLVYDAHSSCEHLSKWWGQRGSTLAVCEMEFRPGGAWRFVERDKEGAEHGFRGVYQELVRPERMVQTFEYEGMPGHISVDTMTLVEQDGKTTMTATTKFNSIEDRDGMLQSGMESGATEMWDRLAEYLATMPRA